MPCLTLSQHLRINYIDANPDGSRAVLLLHGLGSSGASWREQVPALTAAGCRVIAPDARGFGESTYPGSTSVAAMAADLAALLDQLRLGSAHVVGISMGGALALQLALDYAHYVERLVLVNTFAHLKPEKLSTRLYFALRFVLIHTLGLETQARAVVGRIFPRREQQPLRDSLREQILQADPRGYRATMRALARFDVSARLSEIAAPTLVITGADDSTIDPRYQARLAVGIPGARREVIPAAGHGVIAERPAEFNRILLEFLQEG